MKRLVSLLLCTALLGSGLLQLPVAQAQTDYNAYADDLHSIGLLQGTDKGYDLGAVPTRVMGAVMLVRLLGQEKQAQRHSYAHPFTDVPDWASPHIGYMYKHGLTQGVSPTLFGANDQLDANSYTTFALRSLGYDDTKGDFTWSAAIRKGNELGLIDAAEETKIAQSGFLRGNMVRMSRLALDARLKGQTITLQDKLLADGAIPNKLNSSPKLRYDVESGLYGYADSHNAWIIQPRYSAAQPFSEGLAYVVLEDGTYRGYITTDGKPAFATQFGLSSNFQGGKALAHQLSDNLKLALIDRQGKVLQTYPASYQMVQQANGRPYLQEMIKGNLSYYLLDQQYRKYNLTFTGIKMLEGDVAQVTIQSDSKSPHFGLYHFATGKLVTAYEEGGRSYPIVSINFAEGISRATIQKNSREWQVYYNDQLEPIIAQAFHRGEDFNEGVALVGLKEDESLLDKTIRYGYLKKDGTWMSNPRFILAESFSNGLAAVKPEGPWDSFGILKLDGTYQVPPTTLDFVEGTSMTREQYDLVKKEAQLVIRRIIKPDMSDLDKLLAINEYIIEQTEYDDENYSKLIDQVPYTSYSEYGVFGLGIAVCQGYTVATKLLLDMAGVENKKITGSVGSDREGWELHTWNLVQINGKYYHVDTTWNDDLRPNRFLLTSDEHMRTEGNRKWNEAKYPAVPTGYYKDKAQSRIVLPN
ncbi:WG repeat-containing protein [Paenibacillus sp. SYP-B4298]|uniref:WG repeat-containing protein n=1 Tax=Paenibacillus sp. SYP-B4298 TaxID=2996034 RepID=UPI0022DE75BE|nr:WG repeat-containing protein [Paenibacillus sp. SYP-B4298]